MKNILSTVLRFTILLGLALPVAQGQVVEGKYARQIDAKPSWIKDGNAEVYSTGFTGYNDSAAVPVDGTGGTVAGTTFVTTTSSPLEGKKSFLLSKDAANRQGIGFAYAFTVDTGYRADIHTIQMKFATASGTFVAGTDITVYLYDVTNSRMVPLTSNSLRTDTNGNYKEQFVAPGSGSYRLLIHVASTSASAYTVKFDSISVTPEPVLAAIPPAVFSATIAIGGTVTNEGGGDWLNGDCSVSGTSVFTCPITSGIFLSTPNCTVTTDFTQTGGAGIQNNGNSTTSLILKGYNTTSAAATLTPAFVICTKTGSNYVPPAVSASNWDFDWTNCPSISGSWVSNTTYLCKWKRQGGQAWFDILVSTSGAPTATGLSLNLPVTIDTAKLISSTLAGLVSSGTATEGGVGTSPVMAIINTTTSVYVSSSNVAATYPTHQLVSASVPFTFGATDSVQITFSVPVVGWLETYSALQLNGSAFTRAGAATRFELYKTSAADCTTGVCAADTGASLTGGITATYSSTGVYAIAFSPAFSTPPICTVSPAKGLAGHICELSSTTTTTATTVSCSTSNTAATPVNSRFTLMCAGFQ